MTLAACLAFYGMVVAVVAPRFLPRLTAAGTAPRFGVLVWGLAVVNVLVSWIAAAIAVPLSVSEWSGRVTDLLRSCLAALRPLGVYQPWAAALVVGFAVLAVVWLGWLMWRVCSHWARAHYQGLRHARGVRLAGAETPQLGAGTVVFDTTDVAAYCVAGPSRTVVVTRGALETLSPAELAAVLAHEHAHLSGRHHLILTLLGAVRRAFPRVPLFRAAQTEVGRLLELCADDAAVKRHGAVPLVAALAAMTGGAAPQGTLGAAGHSTHARALRLAEPVPRAHRIAHHATLTGTVVTLVLGPSLVLGTMALTICPIVIL